MLDVKKLLTKILNRQYPTLTEVQIPVTVPGSASAWASAALPSGFMAIEGYYIDSISCTMRNITVNTNNQTISICLRNWTGSSISTQVNVQVSIEP